MFPAAGKGGKRQSCQSKELTANEWSDSFGAPFVWRRQTNGAPKLSLHSFAVSSFDWQLCLFPPFPAAGNIPKLVKPLSLHNARGYARAIAAAAVNRRRFVAIKLTHSFTKLR